MTTEMKYSELLERNRALQQAVSGPELQIALLSNVIVDQATDHIEYSLRIQGINAHARCGDYDNIVQDVERFKSTNAVILFWEIGNIVNGFHYAYDAMSSDERKRFNARIKQEIDVVLSRLRETPLVLFNLFSAEPFRTSRLQSSALQTLCSKLNHYVTSNAPANVLCVDLNTIYSRVGTQHAVTPRDFYRAKSLYSGAFYRAYAETVAPAFLAVAGRSKKALIFDADNTLWAGIVGEDGIDGIDMSPNSARGIIYAEVQSIALSLRQQGVLLGICSKNNPKDVDEVLANHPDMRIRDEHLAAKFVNWNNKAQNLADLARQLNIGRDAIVFVDDSYHEIEQVAQALPEIHSLLVPPKRHDYPRALRATADLFFNPTRTTEDLRRADMYRQQNQRREEQERFDDLSNYLASLGIRIDISLDDNKHRERIAQLTQKTNQFNLSTKRYTVADIDRFMASDTDLVFSASVSDRFGDNGLTAVVIAVAEPETRQAEIDTFLMSCRIIGRNVELAIADVVMARLAERGIEQVKACYIETPKNNQVESFYDKLGFRLDNAEAHRKEYALDPTSYAPQAPDYIEIRS